MFMYFLVLVSCVMYMLLLLYVMMICIDLRVLLSELVICASIAFHSLLYVSVC